MKVYSKQPSTCVMAYRSIKEEVPTGMCYTGVTTQLVTQTVVMTLTMGSASAQVLAYTIAAEDVAQMAITVWKMAAASV